MTTLTKTSHRLTSVARRQGFTGRIITNEDPSWDDARAGWNRSIDQRPAAVCIPANPSDVAPVIRAASHLGLKVVAQGTGHAAATFGDLSETMLVKTTELAAVEVRPETIVVQAGVLSAPAAAAAATVGRTVRGGSSPDVGVIGFTLGGGLGWLGRQHGLACNAVRSIDIVLPDGTTARVDGSNDPELFWALRGGGVAMGIVTAMEFQSLPFDRVHGGTLVWDSDRADEVLAAYADWTLDLPRTLTSIVRFLNLPDIPEVPGPFRGKRKLTIGIAAVGNPVLAARHIDELRRLRPEIDTVGTMRAADLCRLHGDPEAPTPGRAHHALLSSLEGCIDQLVELAGPGSGSPLVSVEVRHLGGALGEAAPDAGALSHIPAPYVLNAVGMAFDPVSTQTTEAALTSLVESVSHVDAGTYLNFAERSTRLRTALPDRAADRIAAVQKRIDPTGVMTQREVQP